MNTRIRLTAQLLFISGQISKIPRSITQPSEQITHKGTIILNGLFIQIKFNIRITENIQNYAIQM